ncbi:glycoside hydrolase family 3 N-terminal domain-containing protein [Peijinzhouia sedimentorum]
MSFKTKLTPPKADTKGNDSHLKKVFALAIASFLIFSFSHFDSGYPPASKLNKQQWVDSVFNSLSEDQRLGQLFMVAAYSNKDETHYREIDKLVREQHIGGLIFFQGGPGRQAVLTNRYQKAAKVPLIIGMDLEWGLQMRLDSTIQYPKAMTLGAITENSYIYEMGKEIARQCKELGVHINFAPVVDVNSNPQNPVIGYRSFGEDKINVTQKGIAYMKGMQDNGVLASAKHFPGHGDTDSDSHYTLPVIKHSRERLDTLELYPFREMIKAGVKSIMVAHLAVPALDNRENMPTTLSYNVVTKLLKEEMGFEGLIFTDALNMKGVADFYKPGEVDLMALKAGNDVLLFAQDVPEGLRLIKAALANGELKREDIYKSVKKILAAKYDVGLANYKPLKVQGIVKRINTPEAEILKKKLLEKSVTIIENQEEILPFNNLERYAFASLTIGLGKGNTFQNYLGKYAPFTHHQLDSWGNSQAELTQMMNKLKNYNMVVVGLHGVTNSSKNNHGISSAEIAMLRELQKTTKVVAVVFGNPYSIRYTLGIEHLVCAYEDNETSRQLAPQILFGAMPAYGKLPVSPSPVYPVGWGFETAFLGRLFYTLPEEAGMDSNTLNKIDEIVKEAIRDRATPGAQVLVARKGAVVYSKNFGYTDYEKKREVTDETIYDVASLTKVLGTLQGIMFLHERGLVSLDGRIQDYLPELRTSNKGGLIVKDVLTHQAGLIPYIPHWTKTVDKSIPLQEFYSSLSTPKFNYQISESLFASTTLKDSVWQWTIDSELLSRNLRRGSHFVYRYSDIGFYLMHAVLERLTNQPMDDFLNNVFYSRLGLTTLTFHPLAKFPKEQIAPTENDKYFRNQLVWGTVHDQGAAMYGGVAGHAGIFSNANDVAIIMQMNLQSGFYGGQTYLLPETIQTFTSRLPGDNRRGLGWDKPVIKGDGGPTSNKVSQKTFGHTGFTGTAAWVDPESDLVYIFLSNRVHPIAENNKLITSDVRTKIQDALYESIDSYEKSAQSTQR